MQGRIRMLGKANTCSSDYSFKLSNGLSLVIDDHDHDKIKGRTWYARSVEKPCPLAVAGSTAL